MRAPEGSDRFRQICPPREMVGENGAFYFCYRDGKLLKRFQDDAREVQEGFECGLHLANFDDVKIGDVLEVFETREVERTSLDETAPAPAATT